MPVDTGMLRYLSGQFQAPSRALIDEDRSRNALLKEQVANAPMRREAAQLGLDQTRQEMGDARQKSAQGWLTNTFSAIAQSPTPLKHAQMLIQSPNYQAALKVLGMQPTQLTAQDTDDSVRQEAVTMARALGGKFEQPDRYVDETGPGGSLLSRNASTNEVRQIVPREPQGPQPQQATVPSGFRSTAQGNLEYIPGGPADPATAASRSNLRPIPPSAMAGITGNRLSIKQLDRAIAAVKKNPKAFGMQNMMGDMIQQRLDPGGVDARAQVADIGSLKIHDRSGAAVTAAEQPRLKPFIPNATDRADKIISNLENMKANVAMQLEEAESLFTPESGYRPLPENPQGGGGGGMPKVGAVEDGYRFRGGDPGNPNSWERL